MHPSPLVVKSKHFMGNGESLFIVREISIQTHNFAMVFNIKSLQSFLELNKEPPINPFSGNSLKIENRGRANSENLRVLIKAGLSNKTKLSHRIRSVRLRCTSGSAQQEALSLRGFSHIFERTACFSANRAHVSAPQTPPPPPPPLPPLHEFDLHPSPPPAPSSPLSSQSARRVAMTFDMPYPEIARIASRPC